MKSARSCYLIYDTTNKLYLAIPTSNKTWTDDIAHIKFYTSEAHAKKAASRLDAAAGSVILPVKITIDISDSALTTIAKAVAVQEDSDDSHINEILHD